VYLNFKNGDTNREREMIGELLLTQYLSLSVSLYATLEDTKKVRMISWANMSTEIVYFLYIFIYHANAKIKKKLLSQKLLS
jgi:hypothetical protein